MGVLKNGSGLGHNFFNWQRLAAGILTKCKSGKSLKFAAGVDFS
jgi:hypothetical protein